ncbi:MAG: hypothetical protein H7330_07485 [Hymenobacteraceae bacterium]|nr:hypothetical protein [Hymenobacteraceae bacterium]
MSRPLLVLFLLIFGLPAVAQVGTAGPDSVVVSSTAGAPTPADSAGLSRPAKAALWGLIPGGGQVYNRDYWKVPIVYAALGGIASSVAFNNTRYYEFRRAYRIRTDGDDATVDINPRTAKYRSDATVQRAREYFRRNRDLSVISTAVIYGLSIAEALVDAHLSTFSVSDDLSLRLEPTLVPQRGALPVPGVGLTLSLR